MTTILKTVDLIAGASNADVVGRYLETSNCLRLSMTATVVVSANTLSATIGLGGTNNDPLVSTFPLLTTGATITVVPAGWAFSAATGLLTATSPAIGTHEITIDYSRFPKWINAVYDYASGGGTIDARVTVALWS